MTPSLQNILYIEDDDGLARLLQKRLSHHNFQLDIAVSGEEGLKKIEAHHYDLVLLDYHLPGINGLEVLDSIVASQKSLPVILLTASGDERVAVAALERGAVDYAVKDTGQTYFDLLPAIMQASFTKELLQQENIRQKNELSNAFEKAEAANTAKSNFLATMSHEIRTPLNVVIGLTNVLSKSTLDEKQTHIVNTLASNAQLLLKLINDLLDINRIEEGHVQLEEIDVDFSSILHDIHVMFEQNIQDKGLTLSINDETAKAHFVGDKTRIQQILMNLVSNAIKFTDKGHIEINATSRAKGPNHTAIHCAVKDSGIGIAPEKLPTIFDKFTQADETITRRYGGSGLGLSIARCLAALMGGSVTVESILGEGSTFNVEVVLKNSQKTEDMHMIKSPPVPTAATEHTILLVEDYPPNVMVATMMLEDLGYSVISTDNGPKAIDIIASENTAFYAVLMDVQMHGMDGLETVRRIRDMEKSSHKARNIIIGVTAHALAGDRERCISAGMDDYMSKPIHPDILADKLRNLSKKIA